MCDPRVLSVGCGRPALVLWQPAHCRTPCCLRGGLLPQSEDPILGVYHRTPPRDFRWLCACGVTHETPELFEILRDARAGQFRPSESRVYIHIYIFSYTRFRLSFQRQSESLSFVQRCHSGRRYVLACRAAAASERELDAGHQ